MKKCILFLFIFLLLLSATGCRFECETPIVAATTLPVYEFTSYLLQGTDIKVVPLISESVSCLHDYTLQVSQMQKIETAQVVVISGAGLEDFMDDVLAAANATIDASTGVETIHAEHEHAHEHDSAHSHGQDPHIWLSPANAKIMASNICIGLCQFFPEHTKRFTENLEILNVKIEALAQYGNLMLSELSCRDLITFHDGFSYLADAFDLQILHAIEEESGSEASAAELIEIIKLVRQHELPAIFTEKNGSTAAASIIQAETDIAVYTLDMVITGDSYFDAMYHNINTLKEALE